MVAAHPPFGVFVGNEGIPAVAQTRLCPQVPSPLAALLGDLIRVERPGVEVDPAAGRDAATIAFIRIERASGQAVPMVARADPLRGDAELLHPDSRQPVKRFGVAVGEILGVIRRVGGDVDAQREADLRPEQPLRRRFELSPCAFDAHAFRDSRACQEGQREPSAGANPRSSKARPVWAVNPPSRATVSGRLEWIRYAASRRPDRASLGAGTRILCPLPLPAGDPPMTTKATIHVSGLKVTVPLAADGLPRNLVPMKGPAAAHPRAGPRRRAADGAGAAQRQELSQGAQAGRRARRRQRRGGTARRLAAASGSGWAVCAGGGRFPGQHQDAPLGRAGRRAESGPAADPLALGCRGSWIFQLEEHHLL